MIKFRGQRVDNGEWVEGSHHYWKHFGKVVHAIYIEGYFIPFEIRPSTLQVMTTDGWADIADVEVVRKCEHLHTKWEGEYPHNSKKVCQVCRKVL